MFDKILIANRGEIACRVIKTARKMGIKPLRFILTLTAMHCTLVADEGSGPPPANQSYIVIDKVMEAIKAQAHKRCIPVTGSFRNPNGRSFGRRKCCIHRPTCWCDRKLGDKITPRNRPRGRRFNRAGYMGLIEDADEAVTISQQIGYPVMIKASAGGGGKGMRIAWNDEEAREGFQSSKNEAANSLAMIVSLSKNS